MRTACASLGPRVMNHAIEATHTMTRSAATLMNMRIRA
jgi:hypothetical protein